MAALRQDLERVRDAWEGAQSSRDRDAIYGYLTAVFALVTWWSAEGREIDRARRALRLQRLEVSDPEEPFAAVIRCSADPAKTDKRTRSKWSRVMRYAVAYKPDSEALDQFVKRKDGINGCAAFAAPGAGSSTYLACLLRISLRCFRSLYFTDRNSLFRRKHYVRQIVVLAG